MKQMLCAAAKANTNVAAWQRSVYPLEPNCLRHCYSFAALIEKWRRIACYLHYNTVGLQEKHVLLLRSISIRLPETRRREKCPRLAHKTFASAWDCQAFRAGKGMILFQGWATCWPMHNLLSNKYRVEFINHLMEIMHQKEQNHWLDCFDVKRWPDLVVCRIEVGWPWRLLAKRWPLKGYIRDSISKRRYLSTFSTHICSKDAHRPKLGSSSHPSSSLLGLFSLKSKTGDNDTRLLLLKAWELLFLSGGAVLETAATTP